MAFTKKAVPETAATAEEVQQQHMVVIRMTKPTRDTNVRLHNFDGKHPLVDIDGTPVDVYTLKNAAQKFDYNTDFGKSIVDCAKDFTLYTSARLAGEPIYVVEDAEAEAERNVDETESFLDAGMLIKQMGERERSDFSRLFNINPDGQSAKSIMSHMIEAARNSPNEVLKMYENPLKEVMMVVNKARQRHAINKDNGVWKFNDVNLGTKMDEVYHYCQTNDDILELIRINAAELTKK